MVNCYIIGYRHLYAIKQLLWYKNISKGKINSCKIHSII